MGIPSELRDIHSVKKSVTGFPRNLLEFTEQFATEQACRTYLARRRWPNGFVCPHCGSTLAWLTNRGHMFCAACKKQTSPTAGTAMHRSRIPLRGWFLAMWLCCTQKTGLSASGLQRELGVGSYRSAWLMLHKLRSAMVRSGREPLAGTVEVDEAYMGGPEEGVGGRQLMKKCLVVIAVELNGDKPGRVRMRHVSDASAKSLQGFLRDCVEAGSEVHTDGGSSYAGLERHGYRHTVTPTRGDTAILQAEFSHVHLVTSLLKRWLLGTHHGSVGPRHPQLYLDEFAFRFNRRKSRHAGKIFSRLVEQMIAHQPVAYKGLISRTDPAD